MKALKADLDCAEAAVALNQLFDRPVAGVTAIDMGELSRVFRFAVGNRRFVAHFRTSRHSFDKAACLHRTYGDLLPIPRVVRIEKIGGLFVCVSELADGEPIDPSSLSAEDPILAEVAGLVDLMTGIQPVSSREIGHLSAGGGAACASWDKFQDRFFDKKNYDFYGNWTRLFDSGFLEKPLWDAGHAALRELVKFLPESPCLVHGDFHLGNILSDGKRITAVVDWEFAMAGDFMFDLVMMDFWYPNLRFSDRIRESWAARGKEIPHFGERVRFHTLYKALDYLRFFAFKEDRKGYDYCREKLVAVLDSHARSVNHRRSTGT